MFPTVKTSCQNIACGKPIPTYTPHAVSVSLPTIEDVLAYKENKNSWRERICSGYPRFYTHPFEQMASAYIRKELAIGSHQHILLMPSEYCAEHLLNHFNETFPYQHYDGITILTIPEKHSRLFEILTFIRHTGSKAYTRQIEDFLLNHDLLGMVHQEDIIEENPIESIKATLEKLYHIDQKHITLYSSGMNGLYTTFCALQQHGVQKGRHIFIQFGHIYFDTEEILKYYSEDSICIESIYDLETLEKILRNRGSEVAAIFTETPTNPFLNICDLPRLREITSSYEIPLVVDITIGTPVNLNVVPYCDVVVESLTKFASGTGEIMGGAVVLNPNSPFYNELAHPLANWGEPLYLRDAQRLAYTIKGYELRVTWSRESVLELVRYLSNHHKVKKVYWSHSPENIVNYRKIECNINSYAPVISVEFDFPLEKIYNRLQLPKGPSLGTDFTLIMPYFYMANHTLMRSETGKQILRDKGINPEMLRISIGCESAMQIIGIFDEALSF